MNALRTLRDAFATETVHAHCDVPCGIYNPSTATIAAQTVHKMVTKIQELKRPGTDAPPAEVHAFLNSMARMVTVKEEHAQKCKAELLILWTDYFKPENAAPFPKLHEAFWKATKLCSKNKQNVDVDAANQLNAAVREIADMFHAAEAAKTK